MLPAHAIVAGPNPTRTAFVLHGILGSANNWRSFARRFVEAAPDWRLVLVDLRNHGESTPAPPPHTLAACATDLEELAAHLGLRADWVIGHSYGGKVALAWAEDGARAPEALWVLDSPPGASDRRDESEVGRVLQALRGVPIPLERRDQLVTHLRERGFSDPIALWMTTNLRAGPDGLVWRFDIDAIPAMLDDYFRRDFHPFLESGPCVTHHVLGGRSDRWSEDELAWLRRPRPGVLVHTLATAGHWVHTDDPAGLLALMLANGA